MAIFHFSAKVVSRAKGQSVVASAAYRAAESLYDERYGITQDYSRKAGVKHSEIMLPEGAPAAFADRQTLWNAVEAMEKRKDSQLARDLEIGLPVELSHAENVELVRDYVKTHFVSEGMIADFSIHEDNSNNPHAHVLLTMREVGQDGFGRKARAWNAKSNLFQWRAAWAEKANEHLASAGHAIRIDHRTLEAQGIELEPGQKIGIGLERHAEDKLPRHISERIAEAERIAKANGDSILADPSLALRAITHQRATFTEHDIARFLHTRTHGAEQFQAALLKVRSSHELVALAKDDRNQLRYTTREMLEAEKSLLHRTQVMDQRRSHGVSASHQVAALSQRRLSDEQETAFRHLTAAGDLKAIVGVAGSGKSTLLAAAREAFEAEGYTVKGAALSGIAAENLEVASGIQSRTLASYEYTWKEGRDVLTPKDVLVIDEAGMIGTKQLERMLAAADHARAKVVLVGDPEQLQAIEAGAAFRGVLGQSGMVELTQVRRQNEAWEREATQALASGRTAEAVNAYADRGALKAAETRDEARSKLLAAWAEDRRERGADSQLILAYTRAEIQALNREAREFLQAEGKLGAAETLETTRGAREMAAGDRVMFLKNDKTLGVKNGSIGTLERIQGGVLQVRLDGQEERRIAVDARQYQDFDYGYASTIHKSQGATVDRAYVLASRYFDRHTSYVALSRHRAAATVFYAEEEFGKRAGEGGAEQSAHARRALEFTLARARPKELAHDYLDLAQPMATRDAALEAGAELTAGPAEARRMSLEEMQARAREAWAALRAQDPDAGLSTEERQRAARERWLAYREGQGIEPTAKDQTQERSHGQDDDQSL